MQADIFAQFGIQPIINAVGYATRVGGSCPHPEVIAAMSAASKYYFEIDDLLTAAGKLIQRCTGAESGIITCGASAALTLAAAACLAGNRPEIMDQLPDVSGCPRHEIIYPEPGPFDYDHATATLQGGALQRGLGQIGAVVRGVQPGAKAVIWPANAKERQGMQRLRLHLLAVASIVGLGVVMLLGLALPRRRAGAARVG